jgi:hypothetical protein
MNEPHAAIGPISPVAHEHTMVNYCGVCGGACVRVWRVVCGVCVLCVCVRYRG